jgi:hypothetical protein
VEIGGIKFEQIKNPEPSWSVDTVPTIRLYVGKPTPADKGFIAYLGPRTKEAVLKFIKDNCSVRV